MLILTPPLLFLSPAVELFGSFFPLQHVPSLKYQTNLHTRLTVTGLFFFFLALQSRVFTFTANVPPLGAFLKLFRFGKSPLVSLLVIIDVG